MLSRLETVNLQWHKFAPLYDFLHKCPVLGPRAERAIYSTDPELGFYQVGKWKE